MQSVGHLWVNWEWAHRRKAPSANTFRRQILRVMPEEIVGAIRENPEAWDGDAAAVAP